MHITTLHEVDKISPRCRILIGEEMLWRDNEENGSCLTKSMPGEGLCSISYCSWVFVWHYRCLKDNPDRESSLHERGFNCFTVHRPMGEKINPRCRTLKSFLIYVHCFSEVTICFYMQLEEFLLFGKLGWQWFGHHQLSLTLNYFLTHFVLFLGGNKLIFLSTEFAPKWFIGEESWCLVLCFFFFFDLVVLFGYFLLWITYFQSLLKWWRVNVISWSWSLGP